MDRDLVSIGKEPLLLSLPIYSDKKRESSVVGYSIMITTIWRLFIQERRKVMLNIDISEIVVNVNKISVS